MVQMLIDFSELKGPHSGKNLTSTIHHTMKSLGLDKKVCQYLPMPHTMLMANSSLVSQPIVRVTMEQ